MVDARILHRLLLVCLLAGIGFSAFAAFEVLDPALQSSCSVSAFFSCGAVDKSGRTSIGPVPDWSIGLAGFVLMLAVDVPLLRSYDPRLLFGLLGLAALGLAIAGYLAYVELYLIHALCPICLGAYLSDLAVLLLALVLVRLRVTASAASS
ncbi:MAG: vitamin K epoxide reductase family protein [Thermoplasmata archaeon]|nr:vitamin K epoxide reductase family protein [Thermoplasmata archaeon]MCI4341076.1 vitamin K epoxide reductase family protein [Thermoplasmata archaeon]